MHHKERVIAPVLEQELGLRPVVPPSFNTDQFGTFTRDVARPANQLDTAKLKANAALELTGETIALASEGSFGPHPAMPYLPCNREIVVLVDRHHGLELVGEAISIETNFKHATIATLEAAQAFARSVGFPEHGLTVKPHADAVNVQEIVKGITTELQLTEVVNCLLKTQGAAHLETDMRAMYNPTRMQVIRQATQALVQTAKRCCDQCGWPGFRIVQYKPGLLCELCSQPTHQLLAHLYQCQRCGFNQQVLFPNGLERADPAQCQYCNP